MLPQLPCSSTSQASTHVSRTPSSNTVRHMDLSNLATSYSKSLASALPPSCRQQVSSKLLTASNRWTTPLFILRAIKPHALCWNCSQLQREHLPSPLSVLPNSVNSSSCKTVLGAQIVIA